MAAMVAASCRDKISPDRRIGDSRQPESIRQSRVSESARRWGIHVETKDIAGAGNPLCHPASCLFDHAAKPCRIHRRCVQGEARIGWAGGWPLVLSHQWRGRPALLVPEQSRHRRNESAFGGARGIASTRAGPEGAAQPHRNCSSISSPSDTRASGSCASCSCASGACANGARRIRRIRER